MSKYTKHTYIRQYGNKVEDTRAYQSNSALLLIIALVIVLLFTFVSYAMLAS